MSGQQRRSRPGWIRPGWIRSGWIRSGWIRLNWNRPDSERGAASVEAVILIPLLLLVLGVMVGGFRIWDARTQVGGAADAAARGASLSTSAQAARQRAQQLARTNLMAAGVDCAAPVVETNTAGFAVPVGQPAQVEVTITCRVRLSDLLVPGLPGRLTITKSAVAGLDRHRVRSR